MTAETKGETAAADTFTLHLDNFEGPFDLLLQLIAKHELDVTEVALSRVTDEFIAFIRAADDVWDLERTSEFVLVAATLLDLKAARLVPGAEVEDAEDLAVLEARDLLFARLLQYRAFKEIAQQLEVRWEAEGRHAPRPGGIEAPFVGLLPDVVLDISPDRFARIAARALAPAEAAEVSLTHLHAPAVSVREQAEIVVERLKKNERVTFTQLVADSPNRLTTVCRFLALLELYREKAITFEQDQALGALHVVWSGEASTIEISDEFDMTADHDDSRQDENTHNSEERT